MKVAKPMPAIDQKFSSVPTIASVGAFPNSSKVSHTAGSNPTDGRSRPDTYKKAGER